MKVPYGEGFCLEFVGLGSVSKRSGELKPG